LNTNIIHSPPRGVSCECGVALYGAYAADVNLDSSALKNAGVDCSTTWDGSEFKSLTVRTTKECRNACVEEPTARNLNRCSNLVLLSAATRITCSNTLRCCAPLRVVYGPLAHGVAHWASLAQ